jgi:hypothetical protein
MSGMQEGKETRPDLLLAAAQRRRYRALVLGLLASAAAATALILSAQPALPVDAALDKTIQSSDSLRTPETIMREWPERARSIAEVMIDEYGQPNRMSDEALVWYNNGPWQKTVVYRKALPNAKGMQGEDYLEQSVGYQIPADKIDAVKRFDRRIAFNKTKGELSCRSESERLNFLALNLADDIVNFRRSVKDARDFYRRALRLSMSGKSIMYLDALLFQVHNGGNPDGEDAGRRGGF